MYERENRTLPAGEGRAVTACFVCSLRELVRVVMFVPKRDQNQ